jgi:hypothetical protein
MLGAGRSMKALSVRQPWAHLIIHGEKDIENRSWRANVRGRVLIHAANGMSVGEWNEAYRFVADRFGVDAARAMPIPFDLKRGGLIGTVEIVDCIDRTSSRWFVGTFGFVLRDPQPMTFVPMRGALGFFNVPELKAAA